MEGTQQLRSAGFTPMIPKMALFSPSHSRRAQFHHQFFCPPKPTYPSSRSPSNPSRFTSSVQFACRDGPYRETSEWAMLVSEQLKGRAPPQHIVANSSSKLIIKALFWRPKKTVEVTDTDLSLGDFFLKGSEQVPGNSVVPQRISVSSISSISKVSSKDWDGCVTDTCSPHKLNPFVMHGFLSSLEDSNSSVKETGWSPMHIVAKDEDMNVLGVVPLYLKSHSLGEYVFDHSWADAYYSYGSRYYPKLQCCVPFTPVTGPRIFVRNTSCRDGTFDILVSALKELTLKLQVSSLHVTFPSKRESEALKDKGFLQRVGLQYHWTNRNYQKTTFFKGKYIGVDITPIGLTTSGVGILSDGLTQFFVRAPLEGSREKKGHLVLIPSFDEFLMDLKQNKRKNIRQERKKISAQNITMRRLQGDEIKPEHWDTFYGFYRNTTDNKWGSAYLTRDFFHIMGSRMGDKVLLVVAEEDDKVVAGALNLIGGDTLYGRLWGCLPESYYPSLHFEACYYQAIEAAIELNLGKVEAGAQGEHKIQRGYLPVTTYSSHYIVDQDFSGAIQDFLKRESAQVRLATKLLSDSGPFKDDLQTQLETYD